jgi:hypothetical protein
VLFTSSFDNKNSGLTDPLKAYKQISQKNKRKKQTAKRQ